ncbi:MAG: STAS domain-containing protein [bacterium]|nr:STAS domain-containing protein [bacterium]MDZ4341962.1 STAS domain-containing protein [Candidatus Binatia bacterium]
MTRPYVEQEVSNLWSAGENVVEVRFTADTTKIWHDSPLIRRLADDLLLLADDPECVHAIINLAGLSFVSVQVTNSFEALHDTLRARSGRLILCNLPPAFRHVLRLSGRDKDFEITDTVDEAYALLLRD